MCQPEFTGVGGGCWLLAWCRAVPELSAKRYSERRHLALLGDAAGKFYQSGDSEGLGDGIDYAGQFGGDAGPPVDQWHRVFFAGSKSALIVVGHIFGLIVGHVNVVGALGFAGFTG